MATYESRYPKATGCLAKDRAMLLAFYDFPAEHWRHIRTTNPIESTFATVRLRTAKTKGCGSRVACLTMVFRLMDGASRGWRCLNGSTRLQAVILGIKFVDGIEVKVAARLGTHPQHLTIAPLSSIECAETARQGFEAAIESGGTGPLLVESQDVW